MIPFIVRHLSREARGLLEISSWSFTSWLPAWMVPFAVAGIILLCLMCYFRFANEPSRNWRIAMTALRVAAYLSLLLIIARPSLEVIGRGAPAGVVPIVVDGTLSMRIQDSPGRPRIADARHALDACMSGNPAPDLMTFTPYWHGEEFRLLGTGELPEPDGQMTCVASMLDNAMERHAGAYLPGLVLLSDGAHNSPVPVEPAIQRLKNRNIPVYPIGIGVENPRDLAVTYVLGEDVVFQDEKARIFLNIHQNGYTGESIRVRLFMDDEQIHVENYVIAKEGENVFPVEYVPPRKGTFTLRASVDPLPEEVTTENNHYDKSVRVIDESIRVLLVFGTPSWEFRYLSGVFERDRRVEFSSFLATVDPRVIRSHESHFIAAPPDNIAELNANYDLIILSRIDIGLLPSGFVAAIEEFVEVHGGSLALLSDPHDIPHSLSGSRLEPLLPIRFDSPRRMTYRDELFNPVNDNLRLELTDEGSANPLTIFSGDVQENISIWSEFPPIPRGFLNARLKPSSVLIANFRTPAGVAHPAIVHHNYGKGMVLFIGFDSTWRWRREHGNRYFRAFWSKVAQFMGLPHLLGEAAQSAIFTSRESITVGDMVSVRARVSNPDYSPYVAESIQLMVTEDEVTRNLEMRPGPERLGVYETEMLASMPGEITLNLDERFNAPPLTLRAIQQLREFQNAGMDRDFLERLARETGGRFFTPAEAEDLPAAIYAGRPAIQLDLHFSLWDSLLTLVLASLFFSAEWACRRWRNLD